MATVPAGTAHAPELEKSHASTPAVSLEELVYTSAPKLLNVSGAHLGVVARGRGFPAEVEAAVAKQWSYSMPAALGLPESQTLPRFYLLPVNSSRRWTTLSRVQSAGFDHTGRTNPIAHHFAVDSATLDATPGAVAPLVAWAARHYDAEAKRVFYDRWEGDPRELPSVRLEFHEAPSPLGMLQSIPPAVGISMENLRQACLVVAETVLTYPATQRMAVLVIRPAFAPYVLTFLGAVLATLPKAVQLSVTATSHVWEVSDAPSGYLLAFTYPRSPYSERVKERADSKKPVLIDLALKVPAVPAAAGDYASLVNMDFDRWADSGRIPLPYLCDEIDPGLQHSTEVFALKRAVDAWAEGSSYFSLEAVVQAATAALRAGVSPAGTEALLNRIGLASVAHFVAAADWTTVFETAIAEGLPQLVRDRAWHEIAAHFTDILSSDPELIAQRTCDAHGERVVGLLADHDHAIKAVLQEANVRISGRTPTDVAGAAKRWSRLGTKVLGKVWQSVFPQVNEGRPPSAFYRYILDRVIAKAVVPADVATASAAPAGERKQLIGLEYLLRPAWAIVSRQISAGVPPDPLCVQVLDRLVSRAEAPETARQHSVGTAASAIGEYIVGEPIELIDPIEFGHPHS